MARKRKRNARKPRAANAPKAQRAPGAAKAGNAPTRFDRLRLFNESGSPASGFKGTPSKGGTTGNVVPNANGVAVGNNTERLLLPGQNQPPEDTDPDKVNVQFTVASVNKNFDVAVSAGQKIRRINLTLDQTFKSEAEVIYDDGGTLKLLYIPNLG